MKVFKNEFLDKTINQTEPYQEVKILRIVGTGLSIKELAKIIKTHPRTINRYESAKNTAKIPEWYFVILRFLSGDLSYFGKDWINTKINPTTRKLWTPNLKHEDLSPMDLTARQSFMYKTAQNEVQQIETKSKDLERKLNAALNEIEILNLQNQRLLAQNSKVQIVKERPKNVIEFKR